MSREPTVVSGLSRVGPLTTVRGAVCLREVMEDN